MVEIFRSQYEEQFLKRIAPIQQKNIYEMYKKFPNIAAKVIIFGSTTTSACNRYSDVDVLVIVPDKNMYREQLSQFLLALDFEVDILY
ncbi:MAG: nucleotidyltransferase domain-containing protein [Cellulosilyticaceae bacterium]